MEIQEIPILGDAGVISAYSGRAVWIDLIPIEYEGMSIVGPNGEDIFVKTEIGSHYQVLDCHKGPGKMTTHTVCQVNRLQTDCELALTNRNTADVVKYIM